MLRAKIRGGEGGCAKFVGKAIFGALIEIAFIHAIQHVNFLHFRLINVLIMKKKKHYFDDC